MRGLLQKVELQTAELPESEITTQNIYNKVKIDPPSPIHWPGNAFFHDPRAMSAGASASVRDTQDLSWSIPWCGEAACMSPIMVYTLMWWGSLYISYHGLYLDVVRKPVCLLSWSIPWCGEGACMSPIMVYTLMWWGSLYVSYHGLYLDVVREPVCLLSWSILGVVRKPVCLLSWSIPWCGEGACMSPIMVYTLMWWGSLYVSYHGLYLDVVREPVCLLSWSIPWCGEGACMSPIMVYTLMWWGSLYVSVTQELCQQELQLLFRTLKTYHGLYIDVVRQPLCLCDPESYANRSLRKEHPRHPTI